MYLTHICMPILNTGITGGGGVGWSMKNGIQAQQGGQNIICVYIKTFELGFFCMWVCLYCAYSKWQDVFITI